MKEICCLSFGSAVLYHYEWLKLMTVKNIIHFQVIVPKKKKFKIKVSRDISN